MGAIRRVGRKTQMTQFGQREVDNNPFSSGPARPKITAQPVNTPANNPGKITTQPDRTPVAEPAPSKALSPEDEANEKRRNKAGRRKGRASTIKGNGLLASGQNNLLGG